MIAAEVTRETVRRTEKRSHGDWRKRKLAQAQEEYKNADTPHWQQKRKSPTKNSDLNDGSSQSSSSKNPSPLKKPALTRTLTELLSPPPKNGKKGIFLYLFIVCNFLFCTKFRSLISHYFVCSLTLILYPLRWLSFSSHQECRSQGDVYIRRTKEEGNEEGYFYKQRLDPRSLQVP